MTSAVRLHFGHRRSSVTVRELGNWQAFGADTEVRRMQLRRGPAWRRTSRVRPALIATLIAIPLAAGVAVGVGAAVGVGVGVGRLVGGEVAPGVIGGRLS